MQKWEELASVECETLLIDRDAVKSHKEIIQSLINAGCEVRVDNELNRLFNNRLKKAKEKSGKQNISTELYLQNCEEC